MRIEFVGSLLCSGYSGYFECKFWLSWSAITHVQNWPIGPQRVGSRENDVIYSLA